MNRIIYEIPIRATLNDTFSIALEVDVPPGYDWTAVEYDSVVLDLVSSDIEDGYRVFIFKGKTKGSTQLIFNNVGTDNIVINEKEYTIVVPPSIIKTTYGPNIIGNAQMES